MKYIKLLSILFCMIYLLPHAQSCGIYQLVNVEKYQGKTFQLRGKIFYKDKMTRESWAVLAAGTYDSENKLIKMLYNESALDYYKSDDWSPYELSGKIDKKSKYLGVGISISGNDSYYLDDFKLFVKDGKNEIEIPLKNPDFEDHSLINWQVYNMNKNSIVSVSKNKSYSGKQSLFIDNSKTETPPTLGNNHQAGKYMEVNGIKLYYEIYGKGEPLLLLHGNNSSMESFTNQLEALSKKYMVIGLDSRGQGKSTSDDTKLTYELMAGDVNSFLDKLELKNVNVLGWSDGGNIGLILAMQHPDKVKKMAIMGTVLYNNESSVLSSVNGLLRKQVKEMEDKGVLPTDMNYRLKILLLTEPHLKPESLQKIQSNVLVMAGEHDVVKEKHTRLIADNIPNSQLIIFKGADHEAPQKIPQLFNQTILTFFDTQTK